MIFEKIYYFTHPLEFIEECVNNVRYFIQRGKRGYSDRDVWDLDMYLSSWLPKALRGLKECGNSAPTDISFKKWHKMLDEMAYGFEPMPEDYKLDEYESISSRKLKGRRLFAKHYDDLWD